MGCGRDHTIGTPTPHGAVGRDLFLSRPPEEQKAIQEEMRVISRTICIQQNQSSCVSYDNYFEAWKKLATASPFVGYKLLAQDRYEWPDGFLSQAKEKNDGIEEKLWKEVLAFEWIFKNTPLGKQYSFFEEVVADTQEKHPLVFVNMADYLLPGWDRTDDWMNALANIGQSLATGGAKVFDEKLGWKVRAQINDLKFRWELANSISPLIRK